MKHFWTLAAVTATALTGRTPASALPLPSATELRGTPTSERPFVAPDASAPRASVPVTDVSVVPASGRADVIVAVDSSVQVQDFVLEAAPYRVVLDFTGAKLDIAPRFYDKIARGSITDVRYAQYRAGIVRVVVELDGPHDYTIIRGAHELRLAVEGNDTNFAAWDATSGPRSSGARAVAAAVKADATALCNGVQGCAASMGSASDATDVSPEYVSTAAGSVADLPRTRRHTFLQRGNQSSQPRITVTYQDSDIRDVLAAFAAFSGRTIVVGKDVQGTVTAEVRDQPWDVALQSILASQQLAASEDQYGIITVDSYKNIQAKQASEPLITQLVTLNYANAWSLVKTVQSLLARDCGAGSAGAAAPAQSQSCQARGSVVADTSTNTLLVTEAQSHMQDVVNYIRDLDIRTPQVSIKAKIIFVDRTRLNNLGIAYDFGDNGTFMNQLVQRIDPSTGQPYASNVTVVNVGGDALAGVSNAARPYQLGAALNLLYTAAVGKFSLTSFIDATASLQLSDVQAEPSVSTLDNRQAQIQVGEETPIRVIDASAGSSSGGPPVATVQWKESGIILAVTPHITRDGQILMQLHAEQSQLQQVGGDLGYNFFKRAADTKLLVSDGETAVIGGLTETTITKAKNAIPLLGELPLVGALFSQTQTTDEKQDLLILITPRVVGVNDAVRTR
jgi:type IV pilus assembly protein PilQ